MAAFGAALGSRMPPPLANRCSGLVSTGPERVRQGLTLAPLHASSPVLPPPTCGPHPHMAAFGAAPGNCKPPPPANRRSCSVSTGPERIRQGLTLALLHTSSPVLPPPTCGPHPRMAAFGAALGNCTPPPPANCYSCSVSTGPKCIRQGLTLAPLHALSPVLPPPTCSPHPRMAAFGATLENCTLPPRPTIAAAQLAQGPSTSGRGRPWLCCMPHHLCCLSPPAALTLAWQPSAPHRKAAHCLPWPTVAAAQLAQGPSASGRG